MSLDLETESVQAFFLSITFRHHHAGLSLRKTTNMTTAGLIYGSRKEVTAIGENANVTRVSRVPARLCIGSAPGGNRFVALTTYRLQSPTWRTVAGG
jgi:hypothetical protein